jgi:hypothetical protein
VRASAAHAAAALVAGAPLRKWLGGLADTLNKPLLQAQPAAHAAEGRLPWRTWPSAAGALAIAAGLMSPRLSSGMSRLGSTTHPGFLAVKVHDTIGTLHDLIAEVRASAEVVATAPVSTRRLQLFVLLS